MVADAIVPVAKLNVPVAFKLLVLNFASCRFVPVALSNNKLEMVAEIKLARAANKFVEVELLATREVKVALPDNMLVLV